MSEKTNLSLYPVLSRKKLLAAVVSSVMALTSVFIVTSPANAWFIFHKKQPGEGGFLSHLMRKKRTVAATQIGLVPGNPPALYWQPANKPKAALLCLHELGLYSGVFDDLGRRMSREGVAVYAIDLRGFGGWQEVKSSEGKMNLAKTLQDVKGSVEVIHNLNKDTPVFVLGEAMGGALALEAAARYPELIQGVVAAAPGGEHFDTLHNYMSVAGHMMTGPGKDSHMGQQLMTLATPKQELREALASDDMVRMDLTPQELMECQFFMYKTKKFARDIKDKPVLIVHGQKDGESKAIGSTTVYDDLSTKDKKLLMVENGDHYTFEDTKVNDNAIESTLAWIDQHLSKSPAVQMSTGKGGSQQ